MTEKSQFERGLLLRCAAVVCVLLVLAFSGLEAMHSHPHGKMAGGSGACAVCVSAHSNAPTATFRPLPTMLTVAVVTFPLSDESKDISKVFSLFIRPPPSA